MNLVYIIIRISLHIIPSKDSKLNGLNYFILKTFYESFINKKITIFTLLFG
jgi:hypothetical protein